MCMNTGLHYHVITMHVNDAYQLRCSCTQAFNQSSHCPFVLVGGFSLVKDALTFTCSSFRLVNAI